MALLAPRALAGDDNEITFHVGKMIFKGPISGGGSSYGFRLLHARTEFISLGLDVDLLKPAEKKSSTLIPNGQAKTSIDSSSVLGVIRLGPTEGELRPNLLFGMGVHFTTIRLEVEPNAGFIWTDTATSQKRTLIDSGGRGIAIKIQGGADYAFNDTFLAGGFLAWNHMGSTSYETTKDGQALGVRSVSGSMSAITFGINLSARF